MKKKQGFTLIELLAVIVILAVIALIATPIVIGIIEDSRVKANENSAYGIIDSAKYYYAQGLLKPENSIEYNTDILGKLTYNGQIPKSGSSAYVNPDGEVAVALLYGNKCYLKEYSEEELKDGDAKDCKVTIPSSDSTLAEVIKKGPVVTTGSGLYKMSDSEYRYRGGCNQQQSWNEYVCTDADPVNNYIKIGEYLYRIIGIDSQGIKVRSDSDFPKDVPYDIGGNGGANSGVDAEKCTPENCPRNNENNTFCQMTTGKYHGCSVYAAVTGNFTAGSRSGTVTQNSNLYDYLNINGTDEEVINLRKYAQTVTWNIGAVTKGENVSLETIKLEEKSATANFKLGLMNVSDYIIGSLNEKCLQNPINSSRNPDGCQKLNWLYGETGNFRRTLNPWTTTTGNFASVWVGFYEDGHLSSYYSEFSDSVMVVAYLSSDTLAESGEGTLANPWIIE